MLRTSLKKAVALGILAALTIGGGIASAQREDDDGDEDVTFVGGDCDNSGNVGINLSLCGLAAPVSLINVLGSNEQSAVNGTLVDEDEAGDAEGGDCTNTDNTGINLGLCGLAAPISGILVGGENEQTGLAGGGDCTNTDNTGINLGLCRLSLPISLINVLGESEQFAATP
ncbi:MAG: hypothetical protein ACRD0C_14500 [Acidimicrobiia bacterium]